LNSKLSCDTSYATIRDYLIDFEQYGPVIPALIEGAERASAEDIAEQFVPVPNAKI
jgi:hypothetical protein